MKDNTVIVIDNSNYKPSYAEKVPFKAIVQFKDELVVVVKSISTKKEYELYHNQVLEAMDIEDVRKLIDLSKYGT